VHVDEARGPETQTVVRNVSADDPPVEHFKMAQLRETTIEQKTVEFCEQMLQIGGPK
jgi:hypothetical protein